MSPEDPRSSVSSLPLDTLLFHSVVHLLVLPRRLSPALGSSPISRLAFIHIFLETLTLSPLLTGWDRHLERERIGCWSSFVLVGAVLRLLVCICRSHFCFHSCNVLVYL